MPNPTPQELVDAVQTFLKVHMAPRAGEELRFHCLVAANILGIVSRELALGAQAAADEHARLAKILDLDGPIETLNRMLCDRIKNDEADLGSEALLSHLELTTVARLLIDQPNYSGLGRAAVFPRA